MSMHATSGSRWWRNVAFIGATYVILSGCQATQVANRTVNQSSYIPELQYRQVMDNLAMIADNPSALPYFNPLNSSKTTIQRTGTANFGLQWAPFSVVQYVKGKITRTAYGTLATQINPSVQGVQQNIEEWDSNLQLDPVRSIVMQGLYRKVLGYQNLVTPFQMRMVQKFFYDYPNTNFSDNGMLLPDGLIPTYLLVQDVADRQNGLKTRFDNAVKAYPKPTVGPGAMPRELREAFKRDQDQIAERLQSIPLYDQGQNCARQLSVEAARKAVANPGDSDATVQNAIANVTTAIGNLAQQVSLERPLRERCDSYANYNSEFRELYHSLQPGWVGRGTWKDVPKNACYVGRHGKTCVWVTPDKLEQLTNLTIAIVDAATASTSQSGLSTPAASAPTVAATGTAAPRALSELLARPGETPMVIYAPQIYLPPPQPIPAGRDRIGGISLPGPNVVPAPP